MNDAHYWEEKYDKAIFWIKILIMLLVISVLMLYMVWQGDRPSCGIALKDDNTWVKVEDFPRIEQCRLVYWEPTK